MRVEFSIWFIFFDSILFSQKPPAYCHQSNQQGWDVVLEEDSDTRPGLERLVLCELTATIIRASWVKYTVPMCCTYFPGLLLYSAFRFCLILITTKRHLSNTTQQNGKCRILWSRPNHLNMHHQVPSPSWRDERGTRYSRHGKQRRNYSQWCSKLYYLYKN